MRVLYVEDEKYLAEAVKHNLEKEHFDVDLAADGEEGMERALKPIYDCVVLDVMLPKYSGIEILERMREKKMSTPVIMLSALTDVEDKVRGLNAGADDYLAKPFKTVELIARINAVLRRPAAVRDNKVTYGDLVYDADEKTLNGIALTSKEASVISELMRVPEKIVAKSFLLNKIWGDECAGDDNYIEVYVSRLRKLLREQKSNVKIIAIRGSGYKITLK